MVFQGAHILSGEVSETVAAFFTATELTLVSALSAYNGGSGAAFVEMHLSSGTTFDATNLIYRSPSITQNLQARLWFSDAPLLLKRGETLALHATAADVHVHMFGITDVPLNIRT